MQNSNKNKIYLIYKYVSTKLTSFVFCGRYIHLFIIPVSTEGNVDHITIEGLINYYQTLFPDEDQFASINLIQKRLS